MNDNKILIIIVLYKQSIHESKTYNSLRNYLADCSVYFYDNSPEYNKENEQHIRINDIYVHDPSNSGLSHAYNQAAKYALDKSFNWLLLSDQDTIFPEDFIQKVRQAILKNPDITIFAPVLKLSDNTIFSPCRYNNMFIKPLRSISHGLFSLNNTVPVNSGLLVKTSRFIEVNGYDERLKVDFCDFAFLRKIRTIDDKYYVMDTRAYQTFSNEETDIKKILERFNIYLADANNYTCSNYKEKIGLFFNVLKHSAKLSFRTASFSFLYLFFNKFLLKKR